MGVGVRECRCGGQNAIYGASRAMSIPALWALGMDRCLEQGSPSPILPPCSLCSWGKVEGHEPHLAGHCSGPQHSWSVFCDPHKRGDLKQLILLKIVWPKGDQRGLVHAAVSLLSLPYLTGVPSFQFSSLPPSLTLFLPLSTFHTNP